MVALGTILSASGCYTEVACLWRLVVHYISGWILGRILLAGIIIEGDLSNQVAVSTCSTVITF